VTRYSFGQPTCFLVLALTATLAACGADAGSTPPSGVTITTPDPDLLELTVAREVELTTVQVVDGVDRVRFGGVVAPDVNRTVQVGSLTTGRVLEVRARPGDEVKKGQLLLVAHSPELAEALAEAHSAAAEAELARQSFARAELLFSRGAIAEKELQQAQVEEKKSAVAHTMAVERVSLLGGDPARLSPRIELRAPLAGTVVEQKIAGGDGLRSFDGEPLFVIADLSLVWIMGDLHENELAQVAVGAPVEVRVAAAPGRVWEGRVANIARVLDPELRTAKVRVELENHDGVLRPGMFATVIVSSAEPRERLALPAHAIVHLGNRDWVFLPEGAGRYRRVAVQVGATLEEGLVEVRSGVAAGDRVVAAALELVGSGQQ
jgi:cobalt-zinc-cadmium efflux system membrane fusion protein